MTESRFEKGEGETLGEFIRDVAGGDENVLEVARQALGEGKDKVTVELRNRQIQPEPPVRAESSRRMHIFNEIEGFVRYVQAAKGARPVVLVNIADSNIQAVLDDDSKQQFEIARFFTMDHPLLKPWLICKGEWLGVEVFLDFLAENYRQISNPNGRELLIQLSQLRAAEEITTHVGRGKEAINGVVVKTTIQGQSENIPVDLPDRFEICTPLFVGAPAIAIEFDLLIKVANHQMFAKFTATDLEAKRVDWFESQVTHLRKLFGDHVLVSLGTPDFNPWQYIHAERR